MANDDEDRGRVESAREGDHPDRRGTSRLSAADNADRRTAGPARDSEPPQGPTDLSKRSWRGVLKRTVEGYRKDRLGDLAAALTYFGVLAIFPALLALVSVLGLLGANVIEPLLDNLAGLAPGAAQQIMTTALENIQQNQTAAGFALVFSLAVALWSASGYVAAFMRASNSVYGIYEGRPIWKILPLRVAITLTLVVLLAMSAVIVVFTGTLAERVGELLGLGDVAVTVWDIAKWPVLVLIVILIFAILYWAAPNVKPPGFRWITPGSAVGVIIWIIASAGFALYVANFGNYNQTYGAMAGVIIFLIWLWISNIAILFGLELDAELQRGRAIEAGHPPEKEPFVEPRDTRDFEKEKY
jgi:membrane protein